ncbi:MAG: hypothetical protein IT464_02775 [Planctomycetes bacterium]|nr:hypothetical protein [Planctomycetota bacterium]
MYRTTCLLLIALALAGCGGGAVNNQPAGDTTGGCKPAPVNDAAPANKADNGPDVPVEDPYLYQKVKAAPVGGWVALSKDGRSELLKHTKPDLPKGLKYVAGVCNTKAPGGTESESHWNDWLKQAAGAILYHADPDLMDLAAAVKEYAPKIAAGVPEVKSEGEIAWAAMQGGEVLVIALKNKLGTYIVVGIILASDSDEQASTIRQWASSIETE